MGTSKSTSSTTQISRYYTSIHLGVCSYGRGIKLLGLWYGQKQVFRAEIEPVTAIPVNNINLLGGNKKEGGVQGTVQWLPGGYKQTLSGFLAAKLGRTTATAPGFRGVASLFFTGVANTAGFYWAANNPYLKDIWIRVRRPPIGLNPSIALLPLPVDSSGLVQYGANPAHMIFECQTNSNWGEGSSFSAFDMASYELAAQTLATEGFALGAYWNQSLTIEKFTTEIIDHIQAVQFDSIRTGKRTLKLLRNDYDVATLPVIDESNSVLRDFQRKAWGETANEVVVTWTNPETEKDATVTAQDLGAIASQGGIVSTARNYYMVRSEGFATKLAERDLAAVSQPIASCVAETNGLNWDLEPGAVVKLNWPEHNLSGLIMRVMKYEQGSGKITITLAEDIFSLEPMSYQPLATTLWTNPSVSAQALTTLYAGTAPAFLAARAFGLTGTSSLLFPDSAAFIMAAPNAGDYVSYDLYAPGPLVNGIIVPQDLGTKGFQSHSILTAPVAAEKTSTIFNLANSLGVSPIVGDILAFQSGSDATSEIAVVRANNGLAGFIVDRGALDTTPKAWTTGTKVWVIGSGVEPYDTTIRSSGETIGYKLLPRSSLGTLAYANAPTVSVSLSDRAYLPLRPADVKVDTVSFGTHTITGETSLSVTWARRNRLLEASQILTWDAADVAPEAGQTTTIHVLDSVGALIFTKTGLTSTTYTLSRYHLGASGTATIRVMSEIGTDMSLQGHEITIAMTPIPLTLSGDQTGNLTLSGDETGNFNLGGYFA